MLFAGCVVNYVTAVGTKRQAAVQRITLTLKPKGDERTSSDPGAKGKIPVKMLIGADKLRFRAENEPSGVFVGIRFAVIGSV